VGVRGLGKGGKKAKGETKIGQSFRVTSERRGKTEISPEATGERFMSSSAPDSLPKPEKFGGKGAQEQYKKRQKGGGSLFGSGMHMHN